MMRQTPIFICRRERFAYMRKDRVIFRNVTFYVGKVPVFWWPYLYQSLNDAFSFTVTPAYLSSWGPSVLTQVTFPITDNIKGRLRLDYRGRRGVAVGFDPLSNMERTTTAGPRSKLITYRTRIRYMNQTAVPRTGRSYRAIPAQPGGSDEFYRRHLRHR